MVLRVAILTHLLLLLCEMACESVPNSYKQAVRPVKKSQALPTDSISQSVREALEPYWTRVLGTKKKDPHARVCEHNPSLTTQQCPSTHILPSQQRRTQACASDRQVRTFEHTYPSLTFSPAREHPC